MNELINAWKAADAANDWDAMSKIESEIRMMLPEDLIFFEGTICDKETFRRAAEAYGEMII